MSSVIRLRDPSRWKPDDDEEIKIIAPAEMLFLFEMGSGECHRKLTGTCSLDKRRLFTIRRKVGESDKDYCPSLLKDIKKRGLDMPIEILKSGCGHYEFNDGQHRICIAKHEGLQIEAWITTQDGDCDKCLRKCGSEAELR